MANNMKFIKMYDDEYLKSESTNTDAGDILVHDQWYTKEMQVMIPNHRVLSVMVEDDYYVWAAPNGDEYRIQTTWGTEVTSAEAESLGVAEKIPTGTIAYSSNPPKTPEQIEAEEKVRQESEEKARQEAEEAKRIAEEHEKEVQRILDLCPKVFKKKPRQVNKFPLEVGDLVLINNVSVAVNITSISKTGGIITNEAIPEGHEVPVYEAKDVFPYYRTNLNLASDIELGDVLATNKGTFLVTQGEALEFFRTNQVQLQGIYRHTDPEANCFDRESYKRYSSGELVDKNGKKVPESKLNARFKPRVEEIQGSFETELIAKHYGIKVEDVKPKEVKILKTLEILLDHPEFVKQKEWALLVGPSGSGKTTIGVEYAESKGLEYVLQGGSAQLTVDDLLGYNSITTGEYFPSLLRDAIENGKVFILDEIDACNPNTLLALNAFKRDVVQFPDKLVKVHEDFRMIATANTLTYSEDYNARSPMDRATIKRFSVLFYDLTPAEIAVRYGFEETKEFSSKITDKKAYSTAEYDLKYNSILIPKNDLDPRDIQRLVTFNKLSKAKVFDF